MKKNQNLSLSLFLIVFVAFAFFAFKPLINYQEEWEVPAKYKSMENPVAGDDEAMEIGAELYAKHCKSCSLSSFLLSWSLPSMTLRDLVSSPISSCADWTGVGTRSPSL